MITADPKKGMQYVYFVSILRQLKNQRKITEREFFRAKAYYKKLTGTDVCLND